MRNLSPGHGPDIHRALDVHRPTPSSHGTNFHRDLDVLIPPKVIHHSACDWDFQVPWWELSNEHFVSPPTSLKNLGGFEAALCRIPATLNLPQGRMVNYFYPENITSGFGFLFRNQAPLDTADLDNGYRARQRTSTSWRLTRWIDGELTIIGDWLAAIPKNAWTHVRLTWWDGLTEECLPALVVQLEIYEDGAWVDKGCVYDTNPSFGETGIARCGLNPWSAVQYNDNTEIWGPA